MNQITVFGGTGFLGRHIIRQLAKTSSVIRVPTRDPEKALILKPMGNVGQIVPIPCSLRSETAMAKVIGNSSVVINLVGILYEKGRANFQTLHVETAARIARLSKEQGAKRLIHISALGADANSKSRYAKTKALGEQAARTFFPEVTVLRPSVVFGPEDNFFNRFASLARLTPVLPLIGGGTTHFQPVYVGDVADAVLSALAKHATVGQTFELGGPRSYSFREMMELMLRIVGRQRRLINVPWSVAKMQGYLLGLWPDPLLTSDQVELLKTDNIVHPGAKNLRDLGVIPTSAEIILPEYLARYRRNDTVVQKA